MVVSEEWVLQWPQTRSPHLTPLPRPPPANSVIPARRKPRGGVVLRRTLAASFRQLKGYGEAVARAEGRGGCWQVAPAHWERSLCPAAAEPPASPPASRRFGASVCESPVVGAEPAAVPAASPYSPFPSPLLPHSFPHSGSVTLPSPTLRTRMPCPEQPSSA